MRCLCPDGRTGSTPVSRTTPEQSSLCSGAFLCLWQKRRHPPAPLLLLSNCDPLRWARGWGPPCGRFFAEPKISGLTVPSKKKDTTFRRVLLFGFRWKLKCSGEVNAPISAPSAAALRRLRSETRLRAQSAKVLSPAKRLYGAGAPPARWAGNNGGECAASASCIPGTKTIY